MKRIISPQQRRCRTLSSHFISQDVFTIIMCQLGFVVILSWHKDITGCGMCVHACICWYNTFFSSPPGEPGSAHRNVWLHLQDDADYSQLMRSSFSFRWNKNLRVNAKENVRTCCRQCTGFPRGQTAQNSVVKLSFFNYGYKSGQWNCLDNPIGWA